MFNFIKRFHIPVLSKEKVKMSRKDNNEIEGYYWDQFNDCLSLSTSFQLSGLLRKTHFLYWLASEVFNGGFGQYFENLNYFDHNEVLDALKDLGANEYYEAFKEAIIIHNKICELEANNEDEEKIYALAEKYSQFESVFYKKPDPFDFLEKILRERESELVEWVE